MPRSARRVGATGAKPAFNARSARDASAGRPARAAGRPAYFGSVAIRIVMIRSGSLTIPFGPVPFLISST